MRDFKQLKVWQNGMEIVIKTYLLTKELPESERYGLRAQITRAAVSIPSNIAEGSSRESEKDYKRFLEMALGSSFELETQLLILKEIGYSQVEHINVTLEMVHEEQKMLQKFIAIFKPKA